MIAKYQEALKYHKATGWSSLNNQEELLLGYSSDGTNLITDLWIKYTIEIKDNEGNNIVSPYEEIQVNLEKIPLIIKKFLDKDENIDLFIGCYSELPYEIQNKQPPRLFYDYETKQYYKENNLKNIKLQHINLPQQSSKYFSIDFEHNYFTINTKNITTDNNFIDLYLNFQVINNINEIYIDSKDLSINLNGLTNKKYNLSLVFQDIDNKNIRLNGIIPSGSGYRLQLLYNNNIPVSIGLYQQNELSQQEDLNLINKILIPVIYQNSSNTLGGTDTYSIDETITKAIEISFADNINLWKKKNSTIMYKYQKEKDESLDIGEITYQYNDNTFTSKIPPKIDGYEFSGWFVKIGETEKKLDDITLNSNNSFTFREFEAFYYDTYIAKYSLINYPIVYNLNGGEIETTSPPLTYNLLNKSEQINNIYNLTIKKEGYIQKISVYEDINRILVCNVHWDLDPNYENHIQIRYNGNPILTNPTLTYPEGQPIIIPEGQPITFPCVYPIKGSPWYNYRVSSVKVGNSYYSCHHKYNSISEIMVNHNSEGKSYKYINITNFYSADGTDITESSLSTPPETSIQYWPFWVKNEELNKWEPGYSLKFKEESDWI